VKLSLHMALGSSVAKPQVFANSDDARTRQWNRQHLMTATMTAIVSGAAGRGGAYGGGPAQRGDSARAPPGSGYLRRQFAAGGHCGSRPAPGRSHPCGGADHIHAAELITSVRRTSISLPPM
jgi:hypothetical protein